jgi:hypothetical protein
MQIHVEGRHAAIRPRLCGRSTQCPEEPTVLREGLAPASRYMTAQELCSSRMAVSTALPVAGELLGLTHTVGSASVSGPRSTGALRLKTDELGEEVSPYGELGVCARAGCPPK